MCRRIRAQVSRTLHLMHLQISHRKIESGLMDLQLLTQR
jgi:hypothetical protein